VLPASIGVRFHKTKLEDLAKNDKFFRAFLAVSPKPFQGVYRCSLLKLAVELGVKPYNVPKILYSIQHSGNGEISYEVDHESFVLELNGIPSPKQIMPLANAMIESTRQIESALVQKLNCMYFVARKVSMPTVDSMLKKENMNEEGAKMYFDFSRQLNDLINIYFSIEREVEMEVQIAGSEEERNLMMPLLYIDSHREKAGLESQIKKVLKEYHHGSTSN